MTRSLFFLVLMISWLGVSAPGIAGPPRFTLHQVLQQVIDNYSALDVADLELKRAGYDVALAERQLAWNLAGRAGLGRDVSAFNISSDTLGGRFGAGRLLQRGSRIDLEALVDHTDATTSFAPSLPNPSTVSRLNLRYREPLWRGRGNPAYQEALTRAETIGAVADAERDALRDQVAARANELFHAAARTYANLANAKRSIDRAQRLTSYIAYNKDLGISEEKDVLQADAQFKARSADEKALRVAWQQQIASLNRLMNRRVDEELLPVLNDRTPEQADLVAISEQARQHSPQLRILALNDQALDATVANIRDRNQDQLDLIANFGPRRLDGDLATGSTSDTELVGGLALEYQAALDPRAKQSELEQALTEQDILRQQSKVIREDLEYDVRRLHNEIRAGGSALAAYRLSVKAEQNKLEEAAQRYREGRADTDELIRFEGDLFTAELLAERQAADLSRNLYALALLRGVIWDPIQFNAKTR